MPTTLFTSCGQAGQLRFIHEQLEGNASEVVPELQQLVTIIPKPQLRIIKGILGGISLANFRC